MPPGGAPVSGHPDAARRGGDHVLADGHHLPAVGFGTGNLKGEECRTVVTAAVQDGYRLIDTAASYDNEREVGRAVHGCGVPREELVVTSKLRGADHGYDAALRAFDRTMEALGLDRLDLYLIHWPLPRVGKYVETWQALVRLQQEGRVRSIGVSNFTAQHLDDVAQASGRMPVVNQVELHPYFPQAAPRSAHADRGVLTQAWRPLGRLSDLLGNAALTEIAAAHRVTPAQVVLRWHVQLGVVPLPKSADPDRRRANLEVFDFELTEGEMARITGLERGRLAGDPLTHERF